MTSTVQKRRSALHTSLPWRGMLPFPDGTIGPGDRAALSLVYSGPFESTLTGRADFAFADLTTASGLGMIPASTAFSYFLSSTASGLGMIPAEAPFSFTGSATGSAVGNMDGVGGIVFEAELGPGQRGTTALTIGGLATIAGSIPATGSFHIAIDASGSLEGTAGAATLTPLTFIGSAQARASGSAFGSSSLTYNLPLPTIAGTGRIPARGSLSIHGSAIINGGINILGSGRWDLQGIGTVHGATSLDSTASFTLNQYATIWGIVNVDGSAPLSFVATADGKPYIYFFGTSNLELDANATLGGTGHLGASGDFKFLDNVMLGGFAGAIASGTFIDFTQLANLTKRDLEAIIKRSRVVISRPVTIYTISEVDSPYEYRIASVKKHARRT